MHLYRALFLEQHYIGAKGIETRDHIKLIYMVFLCLG